MMFEVFNPVDGIPYFRTHFAWMARLVAYITGGDWERQGAGWIFKISDFRS